MKTLKFGVVKIVKSTCYGICCKMKPTLFTRGFGHTLKGHTLKGFFKELLFPKFFFGSFISRIVSLPLGEDTTAYLTGPIAPSSGLRHSLDGGKETKTQHYA